MVKYIYKSVLLVVVFLGALFFFGRQMETDINDTGSEVEAREESFPYIKIETQGRTVSWLYGYSAFMDDNVVRESMIPLAQDKKISLLLGKSDTRLIKLKYEIVDKESGEIYDTETINAISPDQKQVDIVFDYNFKTSTEYILDIEGISNEGREIHYYTRLKYYLDESNLAKKMDFIKKIHNDTFDKNKTEDLEQYLEPNASNRNTSLAKVDITSSSDLVTFCSMSPKVISQEMVTVKEYNMETACVQYNYFVEAVTDSGKETYHVKEFYRVRHASGHNYLLNFERRMEALFDPSLASVQSSQLKLGITNDTESKMLSSIDEKNLYFARGGTLYRYDMEKNQVITLFSAFSGDAPYERRMYDEQGIRLLEVDKEDTLYFCAYGYFPRGRYEGDVALVLYEYSDEGGLREMVYMPIRSTYQQLREDFEEYGYVSSRGIYYFTVANTVYAYNMSGKRLERLAENVREDTFMTMESANCYVWSSSLSKGYGESITIYNLETDERQMLYSPDEDTSIRLLGVIEDNVVYGYVRKKDITKTKDGTQIVPCYALYIANPQGQVLKEYRKEGVYIQNVKANGNVVNMQLCRKEGKNRYVEAGEDSILNQSEVKKEKFGYSSRVTNKTLTEWYIRFPSSFQMARVPEQAAGPDRLTTSDRTVRLEPPNVAKYYIYALGQITASFESPAKAIREADKQMGVVISSNHQVVWERSGSFLQNSIGGMDPVKAKGKVTNLDACVYMVLKQNHLDVTVEELAEEKKPVYDLMAEYMEKPMNLKGCTLEQILYFVSSNKPVIAMVEDDKAVVITGYDTRKLYLNDPDTGRRLTVSRTQYEKTFEEAGNRYVSYMEK